MKKPIDWSKYGHCPTCDRTAGAPCKDLRYAWGTGEFSRDTPHRERKRTKKKISQSPSLRRNEGL